MRENRLKNSELDFFFSEKSSEIKAKGRKRESDFSEGGIFLEYSLNFGKVSDKIRKKKFKTKEISL